MLSTMCTGTWKVRGRFIAFCILLSWFKKKYIPTFVCLVFFLPFYFCCAHFSCCPWPRRTLYAVQVCRCVLVVWPRQSDDFFVCFWGRWDRIIRGMRRFTPVQKKTARDKEADVRGTRHCRFLDPTACIASYISHVVGIPSI